MNLMLAVGSFGGGQIILVVALVALFFGGKRIPGLARGLGESIREFKKGTREEPTKKP
jgi:sec-independent protein translocase protein TatA